MKRRFCECYVMDGRPKFSPRRSWICEGTRETDTGNVYTIYCRSCLSTWKTRAFYATEVHCTEPLAPANVRTS